MKTNLNKGDVIKIFSYGSLWSDSVGKNYPGKLSYPVIGTVIGIDYDSIGILINGIDYGFLIESLIYEHIKELMQNNILVLKDCCGFKQGEETNISAIQQWYNNVNEVAIKTDYRFKEYFKFINKKLMFGNKEVQFKQIKNKHYVECCEYKYSLDEISNFISNFHFMLNRSNELEIDSIGDLSIKNFREIKIKIRCTTGTMGEAIDIVSEKLGDSFIRKLGL